MLNKTDFDDRQFLLTFTPKVNGSFFPNRQINTLCLCTVCHLKATDQLIQELTSAAMKEVDILREIVLKWENERLQKCINLLLY